VGCEFIENSRVIFGIPILAGKGFEIDDFGFVETGEDSLCLLDHWMETDWLPVWGRGIRRAGAKEDGIEFLSLRDPNSLDQLNFNIHKRAHTFMKP